MLTARPIWIAAILLCATGPLWAQKSLVGETAPEIDVREWVNAGDAPKLQTLRGRPVLILYWGMKCDICFCKAVLRRCGDVHRQYRAKGLEVLGLHIHEATASEVDALGLKYGVEFPLGNGGYNAAWDLKQVPRLFLVDTKGVVVWEGEDLGGEFQRRLTESLRDVDWYGESALPRSLHAVRILVQQRKFSAAIDKLVDFASDPKASDDDKKTAASLRTKLEDMGEREYLHGTSAIRTLDPIRGQRILEVLAEEYRDHPVGRKAGIRLKELAKEEEVQPLLQAGQVWLQLRDLLRSGNSRAAAARAQFLFQKHPESIYVKMATNLLEAYNRVN